MIEVRTQQYWVNKQYYLVGEQQREWSSLELELHEALEKEPSKRKKRKIQRAYMKKFKMLGKKQKEELETINKHIK